jgi:hypothetical protein
MKNLIRLIFAAVFFFYIEMALVAGGAAALCENYFHKSNEVAIWVFVLSMIALIVLYKSKAGFILSALFSLVWGTGAGWALHDNGASAISYIAVGLVVATISYCIHEWRRAPGTYRKMAAESVKP